MRNNNWNKDSGNRMGVGLALGIGIGLALGSPLGYPSLGIALGAVIGIALGANPKLLTNLFKSKQAENDGQAVEEVEPIAEVKETETDFTRADAELNENETSDYNELGNEIPIEKPEPIMDMVSDDKTDLDTSETHQPIAENTDEEYNELGNETPIEDPEPISDLVAEENNENEADEPEITDVMDHEGEVTGYNELDGELSEDEGKEDKL